MCSTNEERPSSNFHSITPEDRAKLGVEPQLIPSIVFTTLRAEQLPNGSPAHFGGSGEPRRNPRQGTSRCVNPSSITKSFNNQVVSSATANPDAKRRRFRVLRGVAPAYSVLPKSYSPPGVTLSGTIPHTSGGFADVWKGRLDGNQVCIKTFRTPATADLDKIRWACANPLLRRGGEPNLIPIRGSTVRPCG